MLDRLESISRVLCLGLGALLLLQLVNAGWHGDPLGSVTVPDLPTLPAAAANTNGPAAEKSVMAGKTNSTKSIMATPSIKTNTYTNLAAAVPGKTNLVSLTNNVTGQTNSEPIVKTGRRRPGMPGRMPSKKVDLPAAIQARVDRIVQSEILGPFIRPMPMALLGIAGEDAFLRSPDGQTGMVKEGAELGSIKLLRIGTNRVLVEEKGEKKELTLFAGMGGDSLLPPETNSAPMTNAPITKKETH